MPETESSRRRRPWRALLIGLSMLGFAAGGLASVPMPRAPLPPRAGPDLGAVGAWAYQLKRARPDRIAPEADLVVIDAFGDGSGARPRAPEEVAAYRPRPPGLTGPKAETPRLVLAHLAIGEAEAHRITGSPLWRVMRPRWLGAEHPAWKGTYRVRYWDPDWQSLLFSTRPSVLQRLFEDRLSWPKPALDRILESGFDGIVLDRVDAFASWRHLWPTAERDMVELVRAISAYAKARRPGFLVVTQNGEELLRHRDYREAIDAVAKEDLLYGLAADESRNTEAEVVSSVSYLGEARAARLPVLVVEHLRDVDRRREAERRLRELGFIPTFASRQSQAEARMSLGAPWR